MHSMLASYRQPHGENTNMKHGQSNDLFQKSRQDNDEEGIIIIARLKPCPWLYVCGSGHDECGYMDKASHFIKVYKSAIC